MRFLGNTRASIQNSNERNHPGSFTSHIASIALIVLGADLAGNPLKELERALWTWFLWISSKRTKPLQTAYLEKVIKLNYRHLSCPSKMSSGTKHSNSHPKTKMKTPHKTSLVPQSLFAAERMKAQRAIWSRAYRLSNYNLGHVVGADDRSTARCLQGKDWEAALQAAWLGR